MSEGMKRISPFSMPIPGQDIILTVKTGFPSRMSKYGAIFVLICLRSSILIEWHSSKVSKNFLIISG